MILTSQQVKEFALSHGMDMCGIASIDRFMTSPEGKHPYDILPGCKSVIVIGVRLLEGVIEAQFRNFEDNNPLAQGIYGTYGYTIAPNFHLLSTIYTVAQYIERTTGETTTPVPCGPFGNSIPLSVRHAAVAAGLGEFGWMSIVVTPEFGPRNRFGVILTQAELEPDPMYSGPKLCGMEKCQICSHICPTKAIGKLGECESRKVDMGGKHYEYAPIDFSRCQVAAHGLRKEFGGSHDWITTDSPTPQDIQNAFAAVGPQNDGLQHYPTWHCGRCLAYCPIGNWHKKYAAKGLSRFDPKQLKKTCSDCSEK